MKQAALLLLLLLLAACGEPIEGPDGGSDGGVLWAEGTLELGGEAADGGYLPLPPESFATPGAQGGYHLAVLYQVTGQALERVVFAHRVTRVRDDVLVSKGTRTLDVTPVAAGASWITPGPVIIFICPTPVGVNVVDEELNFEVTAAKGGVVLGRAAARSVFRCAATDSFCASICSG